MTITVIGTGFVGVVTAGVFAELGHQVYGLDVDQKKIASLNQGDLPFFEPELKELVLAGLQTKRLQFTTDYQVAIPDSQVIFVCVGTPSADSGAVDLTYVESALLEVAKYLKPEAIVVVKSTVPPGSFDHFAKIMQEVTKVPVALASAPEFLREGSAVSETRHPSRVVIGTTDDRVFTILRNLHQPLGAPILQISPASAQMGKYAANAYLATRITFINQIADLCQHNGADIEEVIKSMGFDPRIGNHFWYPGLGYGGSCFPKDVKELAYFSRTVGYGDNWFNSMQEYNEGRITRILDDVLVKVGRVDGQKIAVLGLSFKPNTDDTREAPALKVIPYLLQKGVAQIQVYDPQVQLSRTPFANHSEIDQVNQSTNIAQACQDADGIILLIEWPEIVEFEYSQIRNKSKNQWLLDARNQLDPQALSDAGFQYLSIGRTWNKSHE